MFRSRTPYSRSVGERMRAYNESYKIDPFNAKGQTLRCGLPNFLEQICNDRSPCPLMVLLYAKMGLHRHNLRKGTNFELDSVTKYIKTTGLPPIYTYFITLVARDPSSFSSPFTFLTRVDARSCGQFILTCYIAAPLWVVDIHANRDYFFSRSLTECPPQNPFQNTDAFYLLKKSELQDNAWIRLYLELVVIKDTRKANRDHGLSDLKIVKVAMDATEDEKKEGLNRNNAVFCR